MTSTQRAERMEAAITDLLGNTNHMSDDEVVIDMLTELFHWLRWRGDGNTDSDFVASRVETAHGHFDTEIETE